MFHWVRVRSSVFTAAATLALLFSFVPHGDATVAPDAVHWKNGELIAPLPSDAQIRAAAVAQARSLAATRSLSGRDGRKVVLESTGFAPTVHATHAGKNRMPMQASTVPSASSARWLDDLHARLQVPDDPNTQAMPLDPARAIVPPSSSTTVLSNTFDGIDDTGWDPAAPDITVGPDHLLVATTDRFAVMDKCGTTLYTQLFQTEFGLPGSRTYYTPKVIYDSWTPRWIMIFIGTEGALTDSAVYIAISNTANPLDGWYLYTIGVAYFPGLKDGPSVAVTPEEIYISYNQFNLGTFAFERAVILELVKDDAYAAGGVTLYNKMAMTNPNDATLAFGVEAAQMHSYAGTMYFINSKPGGDDFFTMWELVGPPGGSILTGFDIATAPAYAPPPDMPQPNATLVDAGDSRMRDAVYRSGHLYAAFGRANAALATMQIERIDVDTLAETYVFLGGTTHQAFGAIDVDENDQVTIVFSRVSPSVFLTAYFVTFAYPAITLDSGVIANGLANFSSGSAPYRWGPYFGAALDPSDSRTVWVQGTYASTSPANSWTTRVGAITQYTPSNLVATPQTSAWISGFEGGPFEPNLVVFELSNTGATTAHWRLESVPAWLTPSASSGALDAGATQDVSLTVNATADGMASGIYNDSVIFNNCTGLDEGSKAVTLAIGLDGSCPGAQVSLIPDVASIGNAVSPASTELGVFVTAIRDVSVCAIGIEASVDAPVDATVHIYAADGNTRGALLASSAPYTIVDPDAQIHAIPVDFDFTACSEYDIAVEFADAVAWRYWTDPSTSSSPLDAGGLIRVRNAETDGNAADNRMPRIKVFTDIVTGPNSTDLAAAAGYGFEVSANQARGNFVIAERTMRIHSLGLEADLVPGTTLTARIYKAAGAARTGLIAEGTVVVASAAFTFHDVPLSAVLLAGSQYDIEVEWEQNAVWGSYAIPPAVIPYTVANTMTIYGTEMGGVIATDIPHLRVSWSDETPASHFILAKPGQPLPSPLTSNGSLSHGAYITSLIDQEMYGLGVMADIPDGGFLTAFIYRAVGTTRGPLIATAVVISDGGGMKWHDVPLSATLYAANEYDIAFSAPNPIVWPYWLDTSGLPYDVYGTFRVRDAEAGGVIGTAFLAHMRVHGCNATLTDVIDKPQRPPMMLLAPAPNPTNAMVRFRYSVEEAGDVEIAIYDVVGRRVAQVARKTATKAGLDAVDFDTSKLASGVYFVKLSTPTKSASRKFVVTH